MFASKSGFRALMLICATLSTIDASAAKTYFGHRVFISDRAGEQILLVDDQQIATADHVFINETGTVGDFGIVSVELLTGGSSCAPQAALIVFVKDKTPQLVAPEADCRHAAVNIGKENVTFTADARPSRDGSRWTWSPGTGLSPPQTIAFQPDPRKTWSNLRSSKITTPGELFEFVDVGAQLRDALGKDFRSVIDIIDDVGSGEFKGDAFVAQSCRPHMCGEVEALIIADIPSRRVFLAWKLERTPIVVRPAVADWPRSARLELKSWAKQWTGNDERPAPIGEKSAPNRNVMSEHIWSVNLNRLNNGELFCEAIASGFKNGALYDVRLRETKTSRALMVTHVGPDVPNATVGALSVDGQAAMVVPITMQTASGEQRAITFQLPEKMFAKELLSHLTAPAARMFTIQVGPASYEIPVFGYAAVVNALGSCKKRLAGY